METAPKDGTPILAAATTPNYRGDSGSMIVISWQGDGWVAGNWSIDSKNLELKITGNVEEEVLTHWMPLPLEPNL